MFVGGTVPDDMQFFPGLLVVATDCTTETILGHT